MLQPPNGDHVQRLSVVIPAYNEEGTLLSVAQRVLRQPNVFELVIVNDCSTDSTGRIADEIALADQRVKVAHQATNHGKTVALKTGLAMTTGEIVVIQDADLEYDPAEIGSLIVPILEGRADVVYGSRFLVRQESTPLYLSNYVANQVLTLLSHLLTRVNLTDVATGYKAFRGEIIRSMKIASSGFGFEFEVTAKAAKLKCVICEVPISYHGRTYAEGKKIRLIDAFAAVWYTIKFNLFCSLEQSYKTVPRIRRGPSCPSC
jgi:glycosyltransferase involved in cell wall biosynthesis